MNLVAINNASYYMDDAELQRETNIAKFKHYAKICFQDNIKYEYDYIDYLSHIARHYAYNLPEHVGEFFISYNNAPHFWISEAPVITNVEIALDDNEHGFVTVSSNYNEIKNFYSKWLNTKIEKEKQYYALSTMNLIERNANNGHVLKKILYANILTFDKRIYAPEKALQLLNEAEQTASNIPLDDETKRELLYQIALSAGIVSFKMEDNARAKNKFETALNYKPSGISAVFYLAMAEKKLQNRKRSIELLGYVVEYDQIRFKHAFDKNSIQLFRYFLNNSITYNIFSEFEFADYLFDIELLIPYDSLENERIFERLFDAKFLLGELYISKYYNDEVNERLAFINKFMDTYKFSKNLMLTLTHQFLRIKFNETLDMINNRVKGHFETLISVELKLYDEQYNRNVDEKKYRDEEANKIKNQYKKDMEEALNDNEEGYKIIISNLEKRIERLSKDVRYDPKLAFNNTMVYNSILSMVIFIIGGFTEGMSETADTSFEVLSYIFYGGIKWGGLTFLLGIIYSLITAISSIWERTSRKNKLQKEIRIRKKQREIITDAIKSEQSDKIKLYDTNHRKKVHNLEQENEELIEDKKKKSQDLSTRYVNLIDDIDKSLTKLHLV